MLFYPTPIGNGFGIASIMSGFDRKNIDVLRGAGFSGDFKDPVRTDVAIAIDEQLHRHDGTRSARIVYTFDQAKRYGLAFVEKGKKYA